MTAIDDIRARRNAGYPPLVIDGKAINFYEQMIGDVDALLAEIQRLQAVADAGRALLDTSNGKTLYECRGDLRDALAALDAGKVSG